MMRIVVGRPGPDAGARAAEHGLETLARVLRDAGHEVVLAGLHQSAQQLAATAVQEDADLVAVPDLHADQRSFEDEVVRLLAEDDAADIGVRAFAPGAGAAEILDWVARASDDHA